MESSLRLDGPYGSRDRRGGGAGLTLSLPPVAWMESSLRLDGPYGVALSSTGGVG